ncbi:cache domain-containing protein [Paenibacillus aestuarii]|uniref:Cache domain-containing protein n=1 Tax=Paenibacillus aestuarii TaxID=516965 RepID=A0ABW0JZW4_9BACL|nr:cache domain-containing protein [Paenibacillus aestuarii]
MLRYFQNRGLHFRLLVYFITLILLPVATLGVIGNWVSVKTLENEANDHTEQMIGQVTKNLDFYVQNVGQTLQLISKNPETERFLSVNSHTAPDQRQSIEVEVRGMLSNFTSTYPEIAGIIIVNENDLDVSNEMYRVARNPLTSEEWYIEAMNEPDKPHLMSKPVGRNITTNMNYSPDDVLSVVMALHGTQSERYQGVVLIDYKLTKLESLIRDITLGKSGFIYIMDNNGEIVYAPENTIVYRMRAEWLQEHNETSIVKTIRNQRYQIMYTESDFTKWKTIGVFSLSETLQDVTKLRNASIILVGMKAND